MTESHGFCQYKDWKTFLNTHCQSKPCWMALKSILLKHMIVNYSLDILRQWSGHSTSTLVKLLLFCWFLIVSLMCGLIHKHYRLNASLNLCMNVLRGQIRQDGHLHIVLVPKKKAKQYSLCPRTLIGQLFIWS